MPLTSKTKVAAACTVLALTSAGQATSAPAKASQDHAAQAIEKALQKHGGDVHRCFEKALADRLATAGMVEVSVDIGKAGKVTGAKVKKTAAGAPPALAACVEKAALGWTIEGIEPGAAVVLPFSFKAQSSQFVVNGSDVPERALGGQGAAKAKAGPKRDAPFTVKVLADETNVRASGISLTQLNVGPASRVAMHRHAHSAKILFLVKGHARLLGPEGVAPAKLDEGSAAFIPAGYPHVIENMGRQSTAVFLQAFSPPGPERVYRDPTDARGREEFEVIRDPSQAKLPPESEGKVVVAAASEAKAEPLGKTGTVKNLIQVGGPRPMSLSLIEPVDGAELQGKGDAASTEILYLVAGGGSVRVGGETAVLAPESMIYVPRGTGYALKAAPGEKGDKILFVQFKVPASSTKPRTAAPAAPSAPKK